MDWFTHITGFPETSYHATRDRLEVVNNRLRSVVTRKTSAMGEFELASVADLRQRVAGGHGAAGKPRLSIVQGDVRLLHRATEYDGALFQVASQFNALEMVGPDVTPEDGVTRYESDLTQGPACAIAAGAATIYRNYLVPVNEQTGQTAECQLDGLADLGEQLAADLGCSVRDLWSMRNGYALCTGSGLDRIGQLADSLLPESRETLSGKLRIGIHRDVEVTDGETPRRVVTQAFCSALPVAYGQGPGLRWAAFAQLVLDAAYEGTLLEGVLNARRGRSKVVLLTLLGGGAFGNDDAWIHAAIRRAFAKVASFDLDVRLVSYGNPSRATAELVQSLR